MGEPGIPITVPIWMILSIKYFPVHQLFIVTELEPACSGFSISRCFRLFFRKVDMHFLDTVFIQLFYDQTNSVLGDHFVTGNRQTIQMFDDKSSESSSVSR